VHLVPKIFCTASGVNGGDAPPHQ